MNDIERAQNLFGEFERKSNSLSGLDELSEALEIVSNGKIDKLVSLFSKVAKGKIYIILQRPEEHKSETLDFWESVADSFISFGDDEFISMRDELTNLKEKAQWEALPERKQIEKIIEGYKALPEDNATRKEILNLLKKATAKQCPEERTVAEKEMRQMNEITETSQKLILLAEDDWYVNNLVCEVVDENFGKKVKVISFYDGKPAFAFLKENPNKVHLIISCIMMPGLNGVDFLTMCKKLAPDIPFIIHTAYTDIKESIPEANAYVVKGADLSELLNEIRKFLVAADMPEDKRSKVMMERANEN